MKNLNEYLTLLNDFKNTPNENQIDFLKAYSGNKIKDLENEDLINTLSEEELQIIKESSLTEYYTPSDVVDLIYQQLENNNITTGRILEPSCGIGNFIKDDSNFTYEGVELSPISSKIASILHPNAKIHNTRFENFNPDYKYNLIIGNVPFGEINIYDKKYSNKILTIHEYFLYKCISLLEPTGIIALIVPTSMTIEYKNQKLFTYINSFCNILRIINMPNDIFKNTNIETSIMFLQRLSNINEKANAIITKNKIYSYLEEPYLIINGYSNYCTNRFGKQIYQLCSFNSLIEKANNEHKRASLLIKQQIVQKELQKPFINFTKYEPIQSNNNLKNIDKYKLDTFDEQNISKLVNKLDSCVKNKTNEGLNDEYNNFVSIYGPIHSSKVKNIFSNHPMYYKALSLERLIDGKIEKAEILTTNIFKSPNTPLNIDFETAVSICLNKYGQFNLDYICDLLNENDKAKLIYQYNIKIDPKTNKFVTKEDFYSGNIREKINILKDKQNSIFKQKLKELIESTNIEDYIIQDENFVFIAKHFNTITSDLYKNHHPQFNTDRNHIINENILKELTPLLDQSIMDQINDLENILKDDVVDYDQLNITPATYWIPIPIIEDFIHKKFDIRINTNTYTPSIIRTDTNELITARTKMSSSMDYEFGTATYSALSVFIKLMTNASLKVYIKTDDNKKIIDEKETIALENAAQKQLTSFNEFVKENYKNLIEHLYKEIFITYKLKNINGDYLQFDNASNLITLSDHQKTGIAKIIHNKNTLLGHCVGAGKTYTMIASAMELNRMGLCKKALFVIPNNLILNTATHFHTLYPNSNVLFADEKSFSPANRKQFINTIALNNFDAIIIGHSQFTKIPIKKETLNIIKQKEVRSIENEINIIKFSNSYSNSKKSNMINSLEKKRASIDANIEKLIDDGNKDTDCLYFEDLGIDVLFVDEAHNYKNLITTTKLNNVAGISTTNSKQAFDMFVKCSYLNQFDNTKIVFATGTPISNSINELYTIQRFLQPYDLEDKQIYNFDTWISIFGKIEQVIELDPTATTFRLRSRIVKYYSLPDLISMISQISDIKTEDDLNLPLPTTNYFNIEIEPSEDQTKEIMKLVERVDLIKARAIDPTIDNMLKVTNDGKKIALDLKLIDESYKDNNPYSKLNYLVSNVLNIYKTFPNKTQLIFCDMSTPKNNSFNIYTEIKNKCIKAGIPANEIEFIHSAKNKEAEEAIHEKTRTGEIRVLLGSTSKLGTGVNVQDKLIAIHDLDVPWRPSDLEQRSGRIKRRGNQNSQIMIFRYITKKTFDAYLWQTLEHKQRFISTIMTNKDINRIVTNDDTTTLSFSEAKALAMGNSKLKDYMEVQNEIKKLKIQRQNEINTITRKKFDTQFKLEKLKNLTATYSNIHDDIEYFKSLDDKTKNNIINHIITKDIAGIQTIDEIENEIRSKIKNNSNAIVLNDMRLTIFEDFYGFKVYIESDKQQTASMLKNVVIKRNGAYSNRISMSESILDRIFNWFQTIFTTSNEIYNRYTDTFNSLKNIINENDILNYIKTGDIDLNNLNTNANIEKIDKKLNELNEQLTTLKSEIDIAS